MRNYFPFPIFIFLCALISCGASEIFPTDAEVKELIVAKYTEDSNKKFYSGGTVENLACELQNSKTLCSFKYWDISHKFEFEKLNGSWRLIGKEIPE